MTDAIVIVGAGHAGGVVAAMLRQHDATRPVIVIGEEPLAPYQRPPLSKAWLKGEVDGDTLALRPLEFYRDHDIDLRLGVRVVGLDRSLRSIALSDGSALAYGTLILATGARARMLDVPGADLSGVQTLRTAADAEAIRAALVPGQTVVVVGGGYVGLEVAASARSLGAEVVVIEREARLLARVACPALSDFFQDYHQNHGVRFMLGASVVGFEGKQGRVQSLLLADGQGVACDLAVVGVGAIPNDELAREAGLQVTDGIVVDLAARTSDPDIFAIGDVTCRPMPLYDRMFRMESVPNALEQAKQAAAAIMDRPPPPPETPWQWSDQYDLKLQIAGYPFGTDRIVVRGEPSSAGFAVFHLAGERLMAVEAINDPAAFMVGRKLIGDRTPVDAAVLSDSSVSMRDLMRR